MTWPQGAGPHTDASAGWEKRRRLSNGGSDGSTGSSAGTLSSIPWCSGAERNLGRCFGSQGAGRSAAGQEEGGVERKTQHETVLH